MEPKYDGGKPHRLSGEDYKILDEILKKTPNVSDILKKLNYTYTKSFMIYYRMPDDAEDQLKKNRRKP